MRRPSPATVRRLILVLLLALWELVPRTGVIPELFLPALSKTLIVLVQGWDEYAHALLVTLYEVVLAMALACGGGIRSARWWAGWPACAACCCPCSPASMRCRS